MISTRSAPAFGDTVVRRHFSAVVWLLLLANTAFANDNIQVHIQQITHGPRHHFFGYIGHCRTIPWNESGRYIVALRTTFQDRLPESSEAADIVLLDTENDYAVEVIEQTRAWNFQQGTMLYWNPRAAETQFFFNDRDPTTGKVFCVLYDIREHRRVKEFRFEDTPFGNSGVSQHGGYFLGINYGRLFRLRKVTGYTDAFDWTESVAHPEDDGIFRVDVDTGEKRLIVSYAQLRDALIDDAPRVTDMPLFINHTLCNREDDRVYFFARGRFGSQEQKIDQPFCVNPDGTNLRRMPHHVGGHPEWAPGRRLIGLRGDDQILYDTDRGDFVGQLGTPEIFPSPGGDVAISPDGKWFVNGYRRNGDNVYSILRISDGAFVRTPAFDQHGWTKGALRNDQAPCWNRDSTQILFPAFSENEPVTRQLYVMRIDVES
jgi:hypothetical protein